MGADDRPLLRDIGIGDELLEELAARDAERDDARVQTSERLIRKHVESFVICKRQNPIVRLVRALFRVSQ